MGNNYYLVAEERKAVLRLGVNFGRDLPHRSRLTPRAAAGKTRKDVGKWILEWALRLQISEVLVWCEWADSEDDPWTQPGWSEFAIQWNDDGAAGVLRADADEPPRMYVTRHAAETYGIFYPDASVAGLYAAYMWSQEVPAEFAQAVFGRRSRKSQDDRYFLHLERSGMFVLTPKVLDPDISAPAPYACVTFLRFQSQSQHRAAILAYGDGAPMTARAHYAPGGDTLVDVELAAHNPIAWAGVAISLTKSARDLGVPNKATALGALTWRRARAEERNGVAKHEEAWVADYNGVGIQLRIIEDLADGSKLARIGRLQLPKPGVPDRPERFSAQSVEIERAVHERAAPRLSYDAFCSDIRRYLAAKTPDIRLDDEGRVWAVKYPKAKTAGTHNFVLYQPYADVWHLGTAVRELTEEQQAACSLLHAAGFKIELP